MSLLLKHGIPVRAFVHKLDARSDELRQQDEIVVGDLLNPTSVRAAMKNVPRAFCTYPFADGLLEANTIFVQRFVMRAWNWW
jgi:uncharacterized protein YbjT (DUF2867 family)